MTRSLRDPTLSALVSLLALAAYWRTLAPTVTFEDSGELITAAWALGVPHEPGYPLFTLIAHAFSLLPLGTVAWRVNLLSAVCTALGAGFVALATAAALEGGGAREGRPAAVADIVAILVAGLTAAFALETWSQAVITEIYGLNFALVSALLWLAVRWAFASDAAARRRLFYTTSFVLGLALGNHPTVAVLAPALLIYAMATGLKEILTPRVALTATAALLAGLTPLLYLPLAAAQHPVLNWGDPETLTNFLRVIGRQQYGFEPLPGLAAAALQLRTAGALMLEQWPVPILILPALGLWGRWREQRRLFWLAALLWLAAAPATALLINFPLASGDAAVDAENRAILSVFFIPAYGVLAFLAGLGVHGLLARTPRTLAVPLALAVLLVPLAAALVNGPRRDFSQHRWAEAYVANLFHDAPPGALVLASWDPFYFPTLYYQQVEGVRRDLAIVNPALLRRSWYVRQLQLHEPLFFAIAREAQEFLAAVEPFEAGEPYDGPRLEAAYLALERALVEAAKGQGREVLTTVTLDAAVAGEDRLEPLVTAYRLHRSAGVATTLELHDYRLAEFMEPRVDTDRMALLLRKHQGEMLRERARYLLDLGDRAAAEDAARHALALLRDAR